MWKIRAAAADDAEAIAELHVTAWRESYAGLMQDHVLAALSVPDRTARWHRILAQPASEGVTFVAEEDTGRLLGFSSCGPQRTPQLASLGFAGEFSALYILRRAQREGLGTALMRAAARRLAEHGHRSAALWVLRDNLPARNFYEQLCGVPVLECEDHDGDHAGAHTAYGWHDLHALLAGSDHGTGGSPNLH
jgi:GNAT superfamily N-acetyltransferase